jgi:hypothetical protein
MTTPTCPICGATLRYVGESADDESFPIWRRPECRMDWTPMDFETDWLFGDDGDDESPTLLLGEKV